MINQSAAELQEQLILEHIKKLENAEKNFIPFVRHVWPDFISGYHHKKIAEKFKAIRDKKLKRLIVNMPPRHTKSEFASFLFPAWLVGHDPTIKIIQTTHTTELAVRFGRKMKNLIDNEIYQQIFDKVSISADSKAAGRWETNHGGEYFAAGVGSAITGRGADLLIIDDPHSEQDALSETSLDSAYEWYTSGPRQRLQPGGAIVIVMTRWSVKDLTGKLIDAQTKEPKADQWELIEFPAILPSGKPVWPEYWDLDTFTELKKRAMEKYKYWEPETVIVEAKASGLPLTDELRSTGIPVVNYTPSRGHDKHVRVNSVAPMFEAGQVWYPDERWAEEVIEECAAFPFGDHDDYVDSTTQALMRYRQGNFVQLPDDYYDEPRTKERREYY